MKKLIRITTVPISLKILLKGQLQFMSQHFEVIAISSPGIMLEEVEKNESVKTLSVQMTRKISPIRDFLALLKLIKIFKKVKPDIVHTHTPKAGLLGMWAAKIAGVEIKLHTVAGLPLMTTSGFKKKLLMITERLTYKFSDYIIPNSKNLTDYILKNHLTIKEKIKVIGEGSSNGIDIEFYKPSEDIQEKSRLLKKQYNIPDDAFIFLFVGRIVKDKGINELVRSFMNLKLKNTLLILTGEFENALNPVEKMVENEILNSKTIIHTGFQNDVRPYFGMADVFVFPSYREGFPNVVLQACAMKIPSIVSDINGSNEIISHGENGLIVPVKSVNELQKAMYLLYNDSDLRCKLAKNAEITVRDKYQNTKIWTELLNEYNMLIKNNDHKKA